MMYSSNGHMSGWGYGFMTVGMVVFWAVLIIGVVAFVRYLNRTQSPHPALTVRPTPEHLLAERFARGEIGSEEYRERLDTLRSEVVSPTSTAVDR